MTFEHLTTRLKTRLRPRLAGTRVERVARKVRHGAVAQKLFRPTVSLILPIYNVEKYLAECMDSIRDQTFVDYEVIVVDDGSPDGSLAIAQRYAASDPRIRIVRRENGGLGAARNTGIRHARGKYLTFVDSDDALPPDALGALVASARETGSDIVVGSVRRFDAHGVWVPTWVPEVHLIPRQRIQLEDFLPLIRNLYTFNKLYRRDFWNAQGIWFREGVVYEDQPLVTQLFVRANGIDVIPDDVYHYRRRDDPTSLSQETASLSDLRQRLEAWRLSTEMLRREAPTKVYHGWLQTLFDAHFHWYITSRGTVDDTYWAELQEAVAGLTADAPQQLWDATSPDKRVLVELTRQNRREAAQEFQRQGGQRLDQWKSEVRPDGVLVELPCFGDAGLDDDLFLLRPAQLRLAHSVESVHWLDGPDVEPGTCSIAGWAYIRKIDLAEHASEVSLVLKSSNGAEHVFPADRHHRPAFPPPVEDTWCDYSGGGFEVTVPLGSLLASEEPDTEWEVLLRVSAAGFTVTRPATELVRSGSAGVIPAATMPDGDRIVASWQRNKVLAFRREPTTLQVTDVRLEGRQLSGVLRGPSTPQLRSVEAVCGRERVSTRLTGGDPQGSAFRLTLPPAPAVSADQPAEWEMLAVGTEDVVPIPTRASQPEVVATAADRVLTAQARRNGELGVTEWTLGAIAEELGVSRDGLLHVAGRTYGSGVSHVRLVTRHKKTRAVGPEVAVTDGRFEAQMRLEHEVYRFGAHPLPTGEHDLAVRIRVGDVVQDVPLKLSMRLNGELPVPVDSAHHEGRLVRGPAGGVRLTLVRPIGDAKGRQRQQQLRSTDHRGAGLTRGVLMRAYFGEHATDNGVAVQRELSRRGSDLPVYWAVQDHAVPVPDGGIPVVANSADWYKLLSSVSYYIDNMYQPEYHRKQDGQVLVQTFHGYPFKVMGHTHWRNLQFSQARIDSYDARAKDWDYLVSPARYATPLLRREFGYDGEVLEIGYPRNDVLLSPDAAGIREATRRSLGLRDDQTVVLYAPTFRDYLAKNDNKAIMADFFDFDAATKELGPDVVILVRGHAFNARSRHRVGAVPGVVDVTDYPEVSDLYLAADAAVVDYSSLRFDFGVTGKPMIFLVPDLQRYKDTRGWLFDFEPTAPGPLASSTAEVVEHLRDLDGVRRAYKVQYDEFRSSYLDLEDGEAARRLVDAVFAPRGDA